MALSKRLGLEPVDLAFIDGMHNAEVALRDFINLETACLENSVILIDDVLPQNIQWTTRKRMTQAWTGDIYKLITILKKYRPDLNIKVFDIDIKGLAIITNLSPVSTILKDVYLKIEQDILSERYKLSSAEEIRLNLKPFPAAEMEPTLEEIKKTRVENCSKKSSAPTEEMYLDLLNSCL